MRKVLVAFVLCVGGAAVAAWWVGRELSHAGTRGESSVSIEVKRGARLRAVLDELGQRGVLAHPGWLYAYARLRGTTQVRSGHYDISPRQPPRDILTQLLEGRVALESFTVAEGLNRWQIRDLLRAGGWLTGPQFDVLCDDAAFLRTNQIPGPTCEGYLFPETYKLARGLAPAAILQAMFATYRQHMAALRATHGHALRLPFVLDERQMVTLASIVEKETGAVEERPHIACVFYNRLQAQPPWRLETDPTVIYAATLADPHFNGNLTRYHLHELRSPYNTYQVYGLPPGPIASPGAAALEAVVSPAVCRDFFFVSANNGTHIFCPTLHCHIDAVRKWQVDYFRHHRPPPPVAAPLSPAHTSPAHRHQTPRHHVPRLEALKL